MDSLLCNEVWLMSPNVQEDYGFDQENGGFDSKTHLDKTSFFSSKEDCAEAFGIFLGRETRFSPEPGYLKMIETDGLIRDSRFKAVSWIIRTQRRMELSVETVFMAVNYLDRFISLNQCQGWKCWTYELLAIACLSTASKFNEATPHLLCSFQMEGPENSFAPSLIQRMELKLLKELDWRMDSTTPFSYIDLMMQCLDSSDRKLREDLSNRAVELLLVALLDPKFLEFKQCVVATAALRCILEEDLFPSFFVIPQELKDDLIKCQIMMEKVLEQDGDVVTSGSSWHSPSSPVTVLFHDFPVDHPIVEMKAMNVELGSKRKRKREELEFGL